MIRPKEDRISSCLMYLVFVAALIGTCYILELLIAESLAILNHLFGGG